MRCRGDLNDTSAILYVHISINLLPSVSNRKVSLTITSTKKNRNEVNITFKVPCDLQTVLDAYKTSGRCCSAV